jgi:hypothetical protein
MDLDTSISVASAILSAGGVPVSRDQLAGLMNTTSGSGTFLMKVAAARMFGLIAYAQGKYELTTPGFLILESDEMRQKAARAEAFLSVPLYRRVYEEFKGKQLPPRPIGLERAFAKFGVSSKQTSNARLAFDKSATQAGFFWLVLSILLSRSLDLLALQAPQPRRGLQGPLELAGNQAIDSLVAKLRELKIVLISTLLFRGFSVVSRRQAISGRWKSVQDGFKRSPQTSIWSTSQRVTIKSSLLNVRTSLRPKFGGFQKVAHDLLKLQVFCWIGLCHG